MFFKIIYKQQKICKISVFSDSMTKNGQQQIFHKSLECSSNKRTIIKQNKKNIRVS